MGKMMKGLDKYDLGTPLVASLFGGTADYGESAKQNKKDVEEAESLDLTPTRRKPRPKSNMLT